MQAHALYLSLSLQEWLGEGAFVFRRTYVACLVANLLCEES